MKVVTREATKYRCFPLIATSLQGPFVTRPVGPERGALGMTFPLYVIAMT